MVRRQKNLEINEAQKRKNKCRKITRNIRENRTWMQQSNYQLELRILRKYA